jgi:hypothetical protein
MKPSIGCSVINGIRKPKKSTKTTKNRAEGGRHNDDGKAMSGYLSRERLATGLVVRIILLEP